MGPTTTRAPRPGLILAATVSAAMLVVANVSSLNVALPELSRELGASQADVQWMVDVYAVFLAALLLPAGALGDRFGRRRMLLFGIIVLIVANAATLFLDSSTPVIMGRAVSGIGAAFVFPATLSTITATLPDEQRGRGVALWTAAVSMGGIIGVLISGLLIESFWWGSVFLFMALAATAVFALCWLVVPDSSDPDEANLDPIGALLSFLAVGGLVLGVIEGPVKGWTSTLSLGGLLVGAAAMLAFIAWEWRNPRPLLDVRLFAERGIRSGSLSIFVQFSAAFGFFFLTVPYLAFVLGYGPLKTGLGLLPVAIGLFPASAAAIPLTKKFGRRSMGIVGLLVLASGFVLGTFITTDTDFVLFAAVMVVFGLGLGLSSPPATEAIVEALPPAKQGVASALNDVLREFGAAIGIAAIGSAFNSGYRATVDDFVGFPDEVTEAVRETPAAAAVIAPDLGPAGADLLASVSQAVVDGWGRGLWLTALMVMAGAAGFAAWAPRTPQRELRVEIPDLDPSMRTPAGVAIHTTTIAAPGLDLGALQAALGSVNARAGKRLGVHFQAAGADRSIDVIFAVFASAPPTAEQLAELVSAARTHDTADILVFCAGDLGAFLTGNDDPAALWVAAGLRSGRIEATLLTDLGAPHNDIAAAITRKLDGLADTKDELALTPLLDGALVELAEPLGAIEIAGAAETDLGRIRNVYRELIQTIDLLETRSTVPADMNTWSAADQTMVAERAALAMAGPLQQLHELCKRALERTKGCDDLVTSAFAELDRVGRPSRQLDELRARIRAAATDAEVAATSLADLSGRFEELAAMWSALRPAAETVHASAGLADRTHRIALAWENQPTAIVDIVAAESPIADLRTPTTLEAQR